LTLHHYGLTTANLDGMSKWYAKVLGMSVVFETSSALGENAPIKVSAAWVTNHAANHRIGLIAVSRLTKDPQRSAHTRLQHIAYE
jgi:catechol 2,3-dioxygenase